MVPPLTGVAVKVTEVPAQTGLAEGAIDTPTGRFVFTVIAIRFETAGFPTAQVALEVMVHFIISPWRGL